MDSDSRSTVRIVTDLADVDAWRAHLRRGLVHAMKARDSVATNALRSALAAIDNAEAPDASARPSTVNGVIAGGVRGLGAGDIARLRLSPDDVETIVRHEVESRRLAAEEYEHLQQNERAGLLRAEADALATFLPAR